MEHIIKFEGVSKRYGQLVVLDRLDLAIRPGERVALIGPSGSGKTTVLRTLMTLDTIEDGVIWACGAPMSHMVRDGALRPATEAWKRKVRGQVGMVFQQFNLFPHMTALQNCMAALVYVHRLARAEARERSAELLKVVGLGDKLGHYPSQLSEGQQQRVAIARALALRPRVMLFDEVTSALDPEVIGEVLSVIRDVASAHDLTILMVTHQMGFAREFAHRVCFFDSGRILEEGPPEQIFTSPREPRTKMFLRAVREGW